MSAAACADWADLAPVLCVAILTCQRHVEAMQPSRKPGFGSSGTPDDLTTINAEHGMAAACTDVHVSQRGWQCNQAEQQAWGTLDPDRSYGNGCTSVSGVVQMATLPEDLVLGSPAAGPNRGVALRRGPPGRPRLDILLACIGTPHIGALCNVNVRHRTAGADRPDQDEPLWSPSVHHTDLPGRPRTGSVCNWV